MLINNKSKQLLPAVTNTECHQPQMPEKQCGSNHPRTVSCSMASLELCGGAGPGVLLNVNNPPGGAKVRYFQIGQVGGFNFNFNRSIQRSFVEGECLPRDHVSLGLKKSKITGKYKKKKLIHKLLNNSSVHHTEYLLNVLKIHKKP